jgi:thiamine pyrophosphate-dependent acetolactate synthase large subunit-like protein
MRHRGARSLEVEPMTDQSLQSWATAHARTVGRSGQFRAVPKQKPSIIPEIARWQLQSREDVRSLLWWTGQGSFLACAQGGFIAQLAWAAIGYGVGATPGVTLANQIAGRTRRTVTITGDGAFAEALNTLGTIAQLGQDAVIFVMDNRIFAVEQWLINADAFCPGAPPPEFATLTDVPQGHIWDYVKLAEGFGGQGFAVTTNAELSAVLAQLASPPTNPITGKPTFTLVAVRLPHNDLPSNARWKTACT